MPKLLSELGSAGDLLDEVRHMVLEAPSMLVCQKPLAAPPLSKRKGNRLRGDAENGRNLPSGL